MGLLKGDEPDDGQVYRDYVATGTLSYTVDTGLPHAHKHHMAATRVRVIFLQIYYLSLACENILAKEWSTQKIGFPEDKNVATNIAKLVARVAWDPPANFGKLTGQHASYPPWFAGAPCSPPRWKMTPDEEWVVTNAIWCTKDSKHKRAPVRRHPNYPRKVDESRKIPSGDKAKPYSVNTDVLGMFGQEQIDHIVDIHAPAPLGDPNHGVPWSYQGPVDPSARALAANIPQQVATMLPPLDLEDESAGSDSQSYDEALQRASSAAAQAVFGSAATQAVFGSSQMPVLPAPPRSPLARHPLAIGVQQVQTPLARTRLLDELSPEDRTGAAAEKQRREAARNRVAAQREVYLGIFPEEIEAELGTFDAAVLQDPDLIAALADTDALTSPNALTLDMSLAATSGDLGNASAPFSDLVRRISRERQKAEAAFQRLSPGSIRFDIASDAVHVADLQQRRDAAAEVRGSLNAITWILESYELPDLSVNGNSVRKLSKIYALHRVCRKLCQELDVFSTASSQLVATLGIGGMDDPIPRFFGSNHLINDLWGVLQAMLDEFK